jgi:GTPase SAR1 family protein
MELSFSFFFFLFFFGSDIRNWIRNIEQHASDNVNKILVGNKADMDESKRVGVL